MAASRRAWNLVGQAKTATTTVATSTLTGTDFPQVGDEVLVAVCYDNLSATTPVLSSVAVSGAGAATTTATASSTDAAATSQGDVQVAYARLAVTTAFTSATVITATLSTNGALTLAKGIIAVAVTGQGTPTFDTPPSAAVTLAGGSTIPTGGIGFAFGALQSTTGITVLQGTDVTSIGTSGGSAATNVFGRMVEGPSGGSASVSAAQAAWGVLYPAAATAVTLPDLVMAPPR